VSADRKPLGYWHSWHGDLRGNHVCHAIGAVGKLSRVLLNNTDLHFDGLELSEREFQPRREADRQQQLGQDCEDLGHLVAGPVQLAVISPAPPPDAGRRGSDLAVNGQVLPPPALLEFSRGLLHSQTRRLQAIAGHP